MGDRIAAPIGSARLELDAGVAFLRPQDSMIDAMLRGWRAQQRARGLRDDTVEARETLIRRFVSFTNSYPWDWSASNVDEWSAWLLGERHLAPSTVRHYQLQLRTFTEFITDSRYGWAAACEKFFGTVPV